MPTRRSVQPKTVEPAPKKRTRVDWPAVERDYRTGKFSDGELAAKHKVSREAIVRARKRDQAKDSTAWAQDLGPQVRAATNTLLMQEMVAEKITEDHTAVTNAVLVTAEINKQVILSHRSRLRQLQSDADTARAKLLAMTETVADVREASTLVSALEASARTTKIVIEAERKAFGLDTAEPEEPDSVRNRVQVEFVNPPQS